MSDVVIAKDSISEEKFQSETNEKVEQKHFRDFLFFFSGQQVSILGSSIVSFVLIWWITITTQSELMLGLASLVSLGPYLIIAPFAGVLADRGNKKIILIAVDSLQSVFTVGLTIIFIIYYFANPSNPTEIPYKKFLITCVFIIIGLRGIMQAFHEPVVMTLIPIMVPERHLSRVNGATYLVSGVIRVVGPVLGAIFLALFDLGPILWIDLVTFCVALIPLLFIKIPSVMKKEEKNQKFGKQLVDGIRVLKETKGLISLLLGATMINFFFTPIGTLLPMFVNKVHLGTQQDYAIVVSLLEAGVIAGSLVMTFFKGFKNKIQTAVICVAILFVGAALLIFIPPTLPSRFWLMGSILFISIAPNPIANVSFITVMQMLIPKDKMGRVMSFGSILAMAITPIGTFISGLIGEYVNLGVFFTTTSLIGLVSFLMIYFLTPARFLDRRINEKNTLNQNHAIKTAPKKQKDIINDSNETIAKGLTSK